MLKCLFSFGNTNGFFSIIILTFKKQFWGKILKEHVFNVKCVFISTKHYNFCVIKKFVKKPLVVDLFIKNVKYFISTMQRQTTEWMKHLNMYRF